MIDAHERRKKAYKTKSHFVKPYIEKIKNVLISLGLDENEIIAHNAGIYPENEADLLFVNFGTKVFIHGHGTAEYDISRALEDRSNYWTTLRYHVTRFSSEEEFQNIAKDIISELNLTGYGRKLRDKKRKEMLKKV